ncbi:MAG: hypothetical protein JW958_03630 [Candidatus Eisenbacteria bacterium]|nr:hypothetical protein [Candidatus Eisenbacteria bacterium]
MYEEPKDRPEDASWEEMEGEGDKRFWGKVRKGVKEGYQYAAEKTDLYAKIGGRRLAIVGIHRKIDRAYTELGERVYALFAAGKGEGAAGDAEVKELVERIREAEADLASKESEIEEIRQEFRERAEREKEKEEGGE